MKIIFNAINCGLGNNGGSQTIVKSANTLADLGCHVEIIDSMKNCFTWHPLLVKHIIVKNNNYPYCDAIIGTGIKTLPLTSNYPNAKKRFHWIRGWETWQIPEYEMIQMFKTYSKKVVYLTNGIHIHRILKKHGIKSYIQYAGLDLNNHNISHNYDDINKRDVINIGGLINFKHKTKNSDWLIQIINILNNTNKYKFLLYTYGMNKINNIKYHIHHINPSLKVKYKIYNKVDFWLSTSTNDSFHIPPAEFMTTRGIVIGVDHLFSGTKSYLINNQTGFLSRCSINDICDTILNVIDNKNLNEISDNAKNFIENKIGSRKQNMHKFIEILTNELYM